GNEGGGGEGAGGGEGHDDGRGRRSRGEAAGRAAAGGEARPARAHRGRRRLSGLGQALSRGRFITLEGGEGAGKSTHAGLLVEGLHQAGQSAIRTREPGGAPEAEEIRRLLLEGPLQRWDVETEALLMVAARRNHLVATVWPAL